MELTLIDKIQIIGKYESEHKIPDTDRVTGWYGDGNMYYELKLYISDDKIEEAFLKAVRELELKWELIDSESGYDNSFSPEEKILLSRFDENYSDFLHETGDEETAEWRMFLSGWEEEMVARWDEAYLKDLANMAEKILNMSEEDEAEI